ncbi:hypothetical protein F2Q68_00024727 [Brassica cretica]|uniref:Uncharacterized protein n=2 Tax=Brassica cretica TaxID=69181 RepID=A0A8S9IL86_BRACR|nr:hypothetical protein F2Q68_00024727 [Brassica cretica]KAF3577718.1 hypothetical protein DY000_02029937 [Brassica cretica]
MILDPFRLPTILSLFCWISSKPLNGSLSSSWVLSKSPTEMMFDSFISSSLFSSRSVHATTVKVRDIPMRYRNGAARNGSDFIKVDQTSSKHLCFIFFSEEVDSFTLLVALMGLGRFIYCVGCLRFRRSSPSPFIIPSPAVWILLVILVAFKTS